MWPVGEEATLRASEIHLPNPSVWPLVASLGLMLFLAGMVLQGPLWVAGAAVALFAFIMWANEPAFDSPEIELEVAHHNRTRISNGMMSAYWFLGSEIALFLMIFSAYFYLLFGGRMAFPEELPNVNLALLNTLFLVSSSITVHVAHHDLNHNKRRTFLFLMAVTLAFGAIFLGVTGFEWREILAHADPRENLYLSAFFTITGLHMLHVIAGLIMLGIAFIRGTRGHFTRELQNGVEVPVAYWHLVDGVWIFVLLIVYVLPIFYQGPETVRNVGDPFGVYQQNTITGEQGEDTAIPTLPESTTPAVAPSTEAAPAELEESLPGPQEGDEIPDRSPQEGSN